MSQKAVFLDRDGVINAKPTAAPYVRHWEEFKILPGSQKAIKRLNEAGYRVFIISNQAGVGKGLMSKEDLKRIDENMRAAFAAEGAVIDGAYYCPHKPDAGCECRKPLTGLFRQAVAEFSPDITESVVVGDSERDIRAGKDAGCRRTVLVLTGNTGPGDVDAFECKPDKVVQNLWEAVEWIMA